jgi:hypothetical protein
MRAPTAETVKVTVIVQLAPALSDAPHVLVSVKSPPAAMLEILKAALPALLSVTVCVWMLPTNWLPNVTAVLERFATGTVPPMPLKLITCGLDKALSVIVITPLSIPGEVGVNVTLMVQFAPTATVPEQSLVSE